jgi:hypothetical protein
LRCAPDAAFDVDSAVQRRRQAEDHRRLHLLRDDARVHHRAASTAADDALHARPAVAASGPR